MSVLLKSFFLEHFFGRVSFGNIPYHIQLNNRDLFFSFTLADKQAAVQCVWSGKLCAQKGEAMREPEKILYHLLNYDKNRELLKKIPHIPYLDLAIVFTRQEENGRIRKLITCEEEEDAIELERQATVNTARHCPVYFHPLDEVIQEIEADLGVRMRQESSGLPMYLLTNVQKFLGAATILYPDLLKNLSRQLGEDFYILPSSVHECILVPKSTGCSREILEEMVYEVNSTQVPDPEILSYQVYDYCAKDDCISCHS